MRDQHHLLSQAGWKSEKLTGSQEGWSQAKMIVALLS